MLDTKRSGQFEVDILDDLEYKVIEQIKLQYFCEAPSISLKNKYTEKDSLGIDYKFISDLYIAELFDTAKLEYTVWPIVNSNKVNIFWELDFKLNLTDSGGTVHGVGY